MAEAVPHNTVLVTGANGFVGAALCLYLEERALAVRRAVRGTPDGTTGDLIGIGDIGGETEWGEALAGANTVVHLAARVHVLTESGRDSLAAFRAVNVEGTRRLVCQAVSAGVKRFVYLSTIKVVGNNGMLRESRQSAGGEPPGSYAEDEPPAPADHYALSKMEAESVVKEVCERAGIDYVIIRPPLIYGPGVKANFFRLLRVVRSGWPLPLASIQNRRTLAGIDNIVHFIHCCIDHSRAANETFHVADSRSLSTPELIRHIALCMKVRPVLFPLPPWMLRLAGRLSGRTAEVERLCGSLTVDIRKAGDLLGWQPRMTVEEGIGKTVDWYLHDVHSMEGGSHHD